MKNYTLLSLVLAAGALVALAAIDPAAGSAELERVRSAVLQRMREDPRGRDAAGPSLVLVSFPGGRLVSGAHIAPGGARGPLGVVLIEGEARGGDIAAGLYTLRLGRPATTAELVDPQGRVVASVNLYPRPSPGAPPRWPEVFFATVRSLAARLG